MKNTSKLVTRIVAIAGIFLGSFAISVIAGTWTSAPPNPPSGNVDAPINVGYGLQEKKGWLNVRGLVDSATTNAVGFTVENGKVGIGTLTPGTTLQVNGGISTTNSGGGGRFGYAADNTGTWGAYLAFMTNKAYFQNADVGIGTTNPSAKLEVVGTAKVEGLIVTGGSPQTGKVLSATDNAGTLGWSDPTTGSQQFAAGVAYIPMQKCSTNLCAKVVTFPSSTFTSVPAVSITPKWARITGDENVAWWVTNITTTGFTIHWHTPNSGTNYGEAGVTWIALAPATAESGSSGTTQTNPDLEPCGGGGIQCN